MMIFCQLYNYVVISEKKVNSVLRVLKCIFYCYTKHEIVSHEIFILVSFFSHITFLQSVTGVWALQLEDAICVTLNHKFKLIAFGRKK